jgi:hypothetical protein
MSVPFRIWPECFRAAKMIASWILVILFDPGPTILASYRTPSLPAVGGTGGGFLWSGDRSVKLCPENGKFFRAYFCPAMRTNQLFFRLIHTSSFLK